MRLRWIIIGVVVVVLGGAGAVAWYVFGDSAPAKPKLSRSQTTTAGGPSRPDGTWRITRAKDVYVGYRIKELFAGARIKRDAVGRTGDVSGTLTIAGKSVRATSVSADVSTLESDRAARDSYIHDHALESDEFPRARFVLSSPITLPTVQRGARVHVRASGRLTLHGTTKPVTLTIDARWNGKTIEVAGSAPIVLADYGIARPETPVVSVDDRGSLEVHLLFARGGAA